VRQTLLQPKDVEVGDGEHWYNAKIVLKTGRGKRVGAVVRYIGFPEKYNAKFTTGMEGLRKRMPRAHVNLERVKAQCKAQWGGSTVGLNADGRFEVERILERVGRGFRVRWAGWSSDYDSYVPRAQIDT